MEVPKTIMLFTNGNVAAFNESGEQMPELQKSWLSVYLNHLESVGIDPKAIQNFEMNVNGQLRYAEPFKLEDGSWNVKFTHF